jgi:hypothetical protein
MMLNQHYKVRGHTYMLYKPRGRNQTYGVTSAEALGKLKGGLRGDRCAYIYHCYNHYFCPIGFEDVPLSAEHAYKYVFAGHIQLLYSARPLLRVDKKEQDEKICHL